MKRSLPLLALLALPAAADVYHLTNGDRITGKTLSRAGSQIRIQTPYGRLTIPKINVQKIVKDDGTEELVNVPTRVPAAPALRVVLIVTGVSFWQAWPAKEAPADPTLRLQVSLDEEPIATYNDAQTDPDIPGAVVNAFSFEPGIAVGATDGVTAHPPEARPGRISLRLDAPAERAGDRRLRVVYQTNAGTKEEPEWRDVTASSIHVNLVQDSPNFVRLRQDRGRMEFSGLTKKRMRNVETFRIEMGLE